VNYTGLSGRKMKAEWQPTTSYSLLWSKIFKPDDSCHTAFIDTAGVVPKVWFDEELNNYKEWDNYNVTSGKRIIVSKWGEPRLLIESASRKLLIDILPGGDVLYYSD
jgi:hypothetical protein